MPAPFHRSIGLFPSSVEEEISIPIAGLLSQRALVPIPAAVALPLASSAAPLPSPYHLSHADAGYDVSFYEKLPCGFRFHAAGREDVDVRMLGEGKVCHVAITCILAAHLTIS